MAEPIQVSITTEGFQQLDRKLKLLAYPEARGIISKALREGAKVEYKAARLAVHSVTGTLVSNIKVRAGKRKKGYVTIKVSIGKKTWTGDAFYGSFVELGHKLGHRKLGKKRRSIKGEHFLEHTAEETAPKAIEAIFNTTKTLLEQLATAKG